MADDSKIPEWTYSRLGLELWLNNAPEAADAHFKARIGDMPIAAGFTFLSFTNAIISFESEKIEEAQNMLRDLEQKCAGDMGWFRSFRARIFGAATTKSMATTLEEQIILADTQLCLAILTGLSQDITGVMKAGWCLRKAWKIYQTTYNQIFEMYQKTFGMDSDIKSPMDYTLFSPDGCMNSNMTPSASTDWAVPSNISSSTSTTSHQRHQQSSSNGPATKSSMRKSKTMSFPPNPHMLAKTAKQTLAASIKSATSTKSLNSKESATGQEQRYAFPSLHPSKSRLTLDLRNGRKNGFTSPEFDIETANLRRLMGAISFGYGVFQLCISLLPPNLLKLISFFGFEGDRDAGVLCLTYAKSTEDMRAPLATLALLWYYTIVTPFFAMDTSNIDAELAEAEKLLLESDDRFSTSALFLFFKGRAKRLRSALQEAIDFYEQARQVSALREIRLLCLHEIGWCRMIQLDYREAMYSFRDLRRYSQFSKSFYAYLAAICQGAHSDFESIVAIRNDIVELIEESSQKEALIEKYILSRVAKMPETYEDAEKFIPSYWKLLVYEMLFMWNALNSCSPENLQRIIDDCSEVMSAKRLVVEEETGGDEEAGRDEEKVVTNSATSISSNNNNNNNNTPIIEPMLGITQLIIGLCQVCLKNVEAAIGAFRRCIEVRADELENDMHVSAFAHYELAMLLLKHRRTRESREEAKNLLLHAQQTFKSYDFDNRLNVRIHSVLRTLG